MNPDWAALGPDSFLIVIFKRDISNSSNLSPAEQQKSEYSGSLEDALDGNDVVVGVLEANVARAIVDRLDSSFVKKTRVVSGR